jgi:hypothetical protein
MFRHVGESGDDLLFWGEFGALLELKVTNGARKSEVSVHTSKVYEASSGTDSCFFLYCMLACEFKDSNRSPLTVVLGLVVV